MCHWHKARDGKQKMVIDLENLYKLTFITSNIWTIVRNYLFKKRYDGYG